MMNQFELQVTGGMEDGLYASSIDVIQVNIGLMCNQTCSHCHMGASPDREEVMGWSMMKQVLDVAASIRPRLVDITGGAPEINPDLRPFVQTLKEDGHRIQIRTNLTALLEPGLEGMAGFFRDHEVQLVASMPCYLEQNVNAQRGEMVYERSVEAIKHLNALGYGVDPTLVLNLVYNPGGAFLPGDQSALEEAYRRELGERFGIRFTRLLTLTNMPIGRFQETLRQRNEDGKYLRLLMDSFNPETVNGLMCRTQISIAWDGSLYDCDFNLALGYSMNHGAPDHIDGFDLSAVASRRIVTASHCFGCTAGCGSSCAGALI
jgi:radical SAM/Cys-rich protein